MCAVNVNERTSALKKQENRRTYSIVCLSLGEAGAINRSQIIWFFQGVCKGLEVGDDSVVSEGWLGSKKYSTEGIVCNVLGYLHFFISVFKQRSGESVKVHQLDVAIPLHLKSQLRKGPPLGGGEGEAESADTMPFVMLTRKGNKQQVRICLPCIHSWLLVIKCKQ